jgi:hypothetical protein
MIKTTFNWDQASWQFDYVSFFNQFKKVLQNACELYFPNYELDWLMRTDASDIAVAMKNLFYLMVQFSINLFYLLVKSFLLKLIIGIHLRRKRMALIWCLKSFVSHSW